jgi:SH3 domain protein
MRFSHKFFAYLLAFLMIPAIAAAETAYVSDQLVITLRRGRSTEHKILKTLKTGAKVEVLERDEDDQYVLIRAQSGEEGYVLSQYLTTETPKPIIISRLEKEIGKLKAELAQAKANQTETTKEIKTVQEEQALKESELKDKIEDLNRALEKTREELQMATLNYDTLVANSGKVVEITDERDRLLNQNKELIEKAQYLAAENTELKRNGVVRWFLAGAGVLFIGWLIGKASRKKQRGLY